MSSNPVRWFEIYVQDMDRARSFYEQVLAVKLARLDGPDATELEMWGFPGDPAVPGSSGALVKAAGVPSGGNSTLVYFGCEDCGVEGARIGAAGGRVMRDKMSIGPYGFIVLAFDTEGNMFGLHSTK
ncbi:MAG TPA: VOC family protein [Steroidobacteraceae bacterium]|nr:VOC family protein [Steroidobacteraceae bacterium]